MCFPLQIRPGGEPRAVGAKDDKMLRLQLEVLLLPLLLLLLMLLSASSLLFSLQPPLLSVSFISNLSKPTLFQAVENENREVSGDDTDEDGDGTGDTPALALFAFYLFNAYLLRSQACSACQEERRELERFRRLNYS